MRAHVIAIGWLLCAVVGAAPVGLRVEIAVSPQRATIGDLLTAQVTVTVPPGVAVTLPGEDADLGGAEVRALSTHEEKLADGTRQVMLSYQITFWEVGEQTVKAPPVAWRVSDGEGRQADRPETTVAIRTVLPPDAEDIKDIRGPREIPLRWHHYLLAALPVVALLGLLGVGIGALRRRRIVARPEPAAPPLSPDEEALQALDQLAAEDLPGSGRIKEHYVRLSWIVRHYVERRWRLPALEATTRMLAENMRGSGVVAAPVAATIVAVLRRADLAKFAGHRPEVDVARADVDEARRIVLASRPPAPEEAGDEGERPAEGGH